MAITTITGPTIAAGQSLSDAVDCSAGQLVRFNTPDDWTDAYLTFQVSTDGNMFDDLYKGGTEVSVRIGPGRSVFIDPTGWPSLVFLKFRSGSSAWPVPQAAARVFECVVETP